jgi:hypothetical protein
MIVTLFEKWAAEQLEIALARNSPALWRVKGWQCGCLL